MDSLLTLAMLSTYTIVEPRPMHLKAIVLRSVPCHWDHSGTTPDLPQGPRSSTYRNTSTWPVYQHLQVHMTLMSFENMQYDMPDTRQVPGYLLRWRAA